MNDKRQVTGTIRTLLKLLLIVFWFMGIVCLESPTGLIVCIAGFIFAVFLAIGSKHKTLWMMTKGMFIVIGLACLTCMFPDKPTTPSPSEVQSIAESESEETETEEEEKNPYKKAFIEDCMKTAEEGETEEAYSSIYDIIVEDLGFEAAEFINWSKEGLVNEKDFCMDVRCRWNKETGFLLGDCFKDDAEISVYINKETSKLDYIKFRDAMLWEDGKIKNDGSSYVKARTIRSYTACESVAEYVINQCLQAPSSAKYEYSTYGRNGDYYVVTGYVDTQNALGVYLRSDFVVEFKTSDEDCLSYEVIYVKLGNDTIGEYVKLE